MSVLIQKVVVEDAAKASPLLPAHVAVVNAEDEPLLGTIAKLGSEASTVASVKDAYNALLDKLSAAGLAKVTE
jgi:hypothetical protein